MTDWAKRRVVDLKAELKRRGLAQHGLKTELVARLTEADEAPEETDQETPQADEEPDATEPAAPVDAEPVPDDKEPEKDDEATDEEMAEDPEHMAKDEKQRVEEKGERDEKEPQEEKREADDDESMPPVDTAKPAEPPRGPVPEAAASAPPAPPLSPDESAPGQEAQVVREAETKPPAVPDKMHQDAAQSVTPQPGAPAESPLENQKRKRRSASPPPSEEAVARKRARADGDAANGFAPAVRLVDEDHPPKADHGRDAMDISEDSPKAPQDYQPDMDYEREVAPSVHPATSALYIKNFMRPLRPNDVEAHLASLASPPGSQMDDDDDVVDNFYLDQVRTHAFAIFKTISAASRVRTALHDTVWPNESNRKALWVDFVPPEKVDGWIQQEQSSGGARSGARWEVVYEDGPDGMVEAHLESGATSTSQRPPPPGPSTNIAAAIPLGPRGFREPGPPTGPRAVRPGTGPGPRPPPTGPSGSSQSTRAHPVIQYQVVSEDLARRRIENMHHYYSPKDDRDFGPDINRYSFEDGDSFVDRGKEVFVGIRPPHRERAMERDRRGGGRGGHGGHGGGRRGRGGFRPRSDRYLPGLDSGRDERRPRFDNDLPSRGSSRFGDDRGRGYRDRRY